ncbi:adenylyl-sulfate kinase [Leifsonia sp. NPDC058248]|uniref:phosphotransferase-like protein n=1 Tax=Leifsonia sp. NPDC058248 TaxID=3346402 RepID=UPI0036DAB8B1
MTPERPGATTVRVLFLNGAVGAGKSTVAAAIGAMLETRGTPHAVIDLDELRRGWPPPEGDRFNFAIELANLRPVAANYVASGARILVLAGVIEEARAIDLYTDALGGVRPTVIRLRVEPAEAERRLRLRHVGDTEGLAWHLHRHGELDAVIDAAGIPGPIVDTTGRTPEGIAREVLDTAV